MKLKSKENEPKVASSEILEKVLELVAKRFNVEDNFVVTSFKDGNIACAVTLADADYEVTVKIRDKYERGIMKMPEMED